MGVMAKAARGLELAANLLGALMFLAIFAAFILQVVMRYVFSWPLGWPEELITILFVYVVFWGAALMVPLEGQISFDLVVRQMPPRARRWSAILSLTATAVLFAAAMPMTVDLLLYYQRLGTPVLDLPLTYVYAPMALFLVASVVRMGRKVLRLLRDPAEPA